jgi:hypothetical protein
MKPGDLVLHPDRPEWGYGILLQVDIDKELMRSPWAVPWKYVVLWGDCLKRRHESGIIRRVRIA